MFDNLMQAATLTEFVKIGLLAIALSFVLMIPFVWIFGRIIALKKKPDDRALWTAALSYLGTSISLIFVAGEIASVWLTPLVTLPGAIIMFYWLRNTYRKGWVDDDKITDGMSLANDDWRVGIGVVLALVIVGTIKAFLLR